MHMHASLDIMPDEFSVFARLSLCSYVQVSSHNEAVPVNRYQVLLRCVPKATLSVPVSSLYTHAYKQS